MSDCMLYRLVGAGALLRMVNFRMFGKMHSVLALCGTPPGMPWPEHALQVSDAWGPPQLYLVVYLV